MAPPTETPAGLDQFGYREQLKRALTTRDLIVFGMVFMVPIAPYAVFGFVWHDAKGMVPLAYLLGLVGMFFTAMSYAAMSRAFPVAGSVYSYVGRGLHELAGFFSGWLILLDYILVPALLYIVSAIALRPLLPDVPAWVWLMVFIAINAGVNFLGVQISARVNWYILLFELVTVALFVTLGLKALYGPNGTGLSWKPVYDPAVFSASTIAAATSIAVLSFLGFDGISTLAEENSSDTAAVGRATLLSLLLVGLLFIVQTWIATDIAAGIRLGSLDTAFYDVAERAGGSTLRTIALLATVVSSAIANAMAAQAAVARILFAMARDGKLPAILARVHPRFKTPYVSTFVVAGISLLVGLLFESRLDDLGRIVNFGALTGFVLLHLAVIHHHFIRGRSGRWVRHLLLPASGLAVIGFVLYEMDASAKIMGGIWIGVGAVYYAALRQFRRSTATSEI